MTADAAETTRARFRTRWLGWLVIGIAAGIAAGFLAGLTRPRARPDTSQPGDA